MLCPWPILRNLLRHILQHDQGKRLHHRRPHYPKNQLHFLKKSNHQKLHILHHNVLYQIILAKRNENNLFHLLKNYHPIDKDFLHIDLHKQLHHNWGYLTQQIELLQILLQYMKQSLQNHHNTILKNFQNYQLQQYHHIPMQQYHILVQYFEYYHMQVLYKYNHNYNYYHSYQLDLELIHTNYNYNYHNFHTIQKEDYHYNKNLHFHQQ